ncbi:GNAT family N-acetyltransferase [Dyadobacter sandarakinus]|uniref:GNAT family N-acetyltransferase n=1 Tax=Dyadobacter sandarakinus TaxID=2747268 RepID=A0ABX7I749_9BACT|nr:GNAT family N-acetyltransferase [Dyadobacter sandarakinus]QRR01922.1 GNAT family N-acetyltransferase [Dyadobacter sandarakinus]
MKTVIITPIPEFCPFEPGARVFVSESPDVPLRLAFTPFLYLRSDHLQTQSEKSCISFYLIRESEEAASACLHCFEHENGILHSPGRAPFGGVQCSEHCSAQEITWFLNSIKCWLRHKKGMQLVVKTAPACYQPGLHSLLHSSYLSAGFIVEQQHSNRHINVADPFEDLLHNSEKRRLRKCRVTGFEIPAPGSLPVSLVYNFIHACRQQKGYPMSISGAQVEHLAGKFPQDIMTFGLMYDGKLAAAALTVQVDQHILYNFLSDYDPAFRHYSPVVLLTKTIHDFCKKQGINMLDLGISLDENGRYKPSLGRFKEHLGGVVSEKLTYTLHL